MIHRTEDSEQRTETVSEMGKATKIGKWGNLLTTVNEMGKPTNSQDSQGREKEKNLKERCLIIA